MQHARHTDVVDVVAVAERQLPPLRTWRRRRRPSPPAPARTACRLRDRLDRVEDLDVAGAAAEVGAEVRLHRVAGEARRPSCRSGPWRASRCRGCRTRTAARRRRRRRWRTPRARPASTPSSVTIELPSTFSSGCWHDTTALPSISTVQHPHCPDGEQPSLGEVTSSSSRSAASRCGCVRYTDTGVPLSTNEAVGVVRRAGCRVVVELRHRLNILSKADGFSKAIDREQRCEHGVRAGRRAIR